MDADGGASKVHDSLWCRYALRQLKHVALEGDDGIGRPTYSASTSMPIDMVLLNSKRFLDVVAPNPEPRNEPVNVDDGGFDFGAVENLRAPAAAPGGEGMTKRKSADYGHRLFFKAVSLNPMQQQVVPGAPKAKEFDSLVVCLSEMQDCNPSRKSARCYIREKDDDPERMYILTPTSFNMTEWKSMTIFHPEGVLFNSLGVDLEPELEQVGSDMLMTLLRADFVLSSSSKCHRLQEKYLKTMEDYNYVARKGADTWHLTDFGKAAFEQSETVMPTRRVMRPGMDTLLADCTTFELLYVLERAGWRCEHPPAKFKAKDLAYVEGAQKVWYLARSAKTFSHSYFVALLQFGEHKLPVEPFRSRTHYEDVIKGKAEATKTPAKRRKQLGFDFNATVHPDSLPESKEVKPIRVRVRATRSAPEPVKAVEDQADEVEVTVSEAESSDSNNGSVQSDVASVIAGASDDRSGSSSSSSSSSSSGSNLDSSSEHSTEARPSGDDEENLPETSSNPAGPTGTSLKTKAPP